jgi:hypothetical protein
LPLCHPTFYGLLPLLLVFHEAPGVVAALLEVHALLCAAAGLSPRVAVSVAEPGVVFLVELEVSEPGVVSVAAAAAAHVSAPRASADIRVAVPVSAPASRAVVVVDSSAPPRSVACPNVDYFAIPASSFEVVGNQCVHNTSGARANHALGNRLSISDLRRNRMSAHGHNKPSRGRSNVIDTNDLPIGATTSRSRRTCLSLYRGRRTHSMYRVRLPRREAPQR